MHSSLPPACRYPAIASRALIAIAAIALSPAATAQSGPTASQINSLGETGTFENDAIAFGDIVANGRARPCEAIAGDPIDTLRVRLDVDSHTGLPRPRYMALVPDGLGGHLWSPNSEQVTGSAFWQRVGVGVDQYVFRAPASGEAMCIGGRGSVARTGAMRYLDAGGVNRFGGFRRIVDASPYRGQRLRFTAWVATRRAQQVNFWLASGPAWSEHDRRIEPLNGGNTNNVRFGGNNAWTPVLLETGPIDPDADHISYGFNLQGLGDVWIFQPRLEIVADQPDGAHTGDLVLIGDYRR